MSKNEQNSRRIAIAVYILLLFTPTSFLSIIGVIIAYIYKSSAPPWLQTHYQFQIRTFWIGTLSLSLIIGYLIIEYLFQIISNPKIPFKILIFFLVFWIVWYSVRCFKGLFYVVRKLPFPKPMS